MTQNNLGALYTDLERFEEAERAYEEALEIRKELADQNPEAYNSYVATTQNNLGVLYWKLKRFEEAERAFEEALEIYKELADKNPEVYNPVVANGWYNKACFDSLRNNKEKSIEFLKRAIDLDKTCLENARTDEDFDNIRNSKEFKELIGE